MSIQDIANRVDGFIEKDGSRVVDMWSDRKNDQIHDRMIQLLDLPRSFSILDVGCGNGRLLRSLERNGYDLDLIVYQGIDVSAKAIEYCRGKYPDQKFEHTAILRGHHDYAFVAGPWAYRQTEDKTEDLRLQILDAMHVSKHGIGYFMYTDQVKAPPGRVFNRFHPQEVANLFPEAKVIVCDDMIVEYVQDVGYADLDKVFVLW